MSHFYRERYESNLTGGKGVGSHEYNVYRRSYLEVVESSRYQYYRYLCFGMIFEAAAMTYKSRQIDIPNTLSQNGILILRGDQIELRVVVVEILKKMPAPPPLPPSPNGTLTLTRLENIFENRLKKRRKIATVNRLLEEHRP